MLRYTAEIRECYMEKLFGSDALSLDCFIKFLKLTMCTYRSCKDFTPAKNL